MNFFGILTIIINIFFLLSIFFSQIRNLSVTILNRVTENLDIAFLIYLAFLFIVNTLNIIYLKNKKIYKVNLLLFIINMLIYIPIFLFYLKFSF